MSKKPINRVRQKRVEIEGEAKAIPKDLYNKDHIHIWYH